VYENNSDDGLYIGTDIGVFYRDSTMTDWIPFMTGLPNVPVQELEIHYGTGKIRAATFGRGLWESDLYGINTSANNSAAANDKSFSVHPNPFTDEFHITLQKQNIAQATFIVENILGETIFSKQENNLSGTYTKTLDLRKFSRGVYLLHVVLDGERTVRKMVKQ